MKQIVEFYGTINRMIVNIIGLNFCPQDKSTCPQNNNITCPQNNITCPQDRITCVLDDITCLLDNIMRSACRVKCKENHN